MDWEKLARAFVHPLRVQIYEAISTSSKPMYSGDLVDQLENTYGGQVSFHLTALEEAGLIVLDHKERRRGATAKFYREAGSR